MSTREFADQNIGSLFDESVAGVLDTINPASDRGFLGPNKVFCVESPFKTLISQHNKSVKISRYFTMGEIVNAPISDRIPVDSFTNIIEKHKLVAYNVLDRLREKWNIEVLSAYRENATNHSTGLAIDVIVPNQSIDTHSQIALFAAERLPVDQIWLERNASGKTHVHLRAVNVGQQGSPQLLTFINENTSVPGVRIDLLTKSSIR